MGIWGTILSKIVGEGVGGKIVDYYARKAEIKAQAEIKKLELDDAIHKRRLELISQGLTADATWELEQIRSSGWKDEYVLVILSIPLIGCFIPFTASYILAGFDILKQTPDWYQWLIVIIFAAVYGIRLYRRQGSDT